MQAPKWGLRVRENEIIGYFFRLDSSDRTSEKLDLSIAAK